ncbi:MAG: ribosome biogenesis GTPase Der [Bacteroidetes bacterium]|jgi:GTP-binding protein|nr:ribosome biogenesis GTPase Der [Bacteroidota bacterium]
MSGVVAIVGRPNVGKSTLYNRLVGTRDAIVDDQSGVTRDRHYGQCDWNGIEFTVVDTGGYVEGSDDIFESAIRKQVLIALSEADVILFVTDVRVGVTDQDEQFVTVLRRAGKPVLVVVNKVDTSSLHMESSVFYGFGFAELFNIAAISGSGTGDMLDRVVELLQEAGKAKDAGEGLQDDIPKFCVIGKPNVGKSTFINALLGEERNIVAPVAGTTRDANHTLYNKYDKTFYLIDTAGIRKKANVHEDIEFYSVMRAIGALEKCDVAFVMIDVKEGIGAQDLNIISLALDRKKGIVILINKWDTVEKETNTMRDMEQTIRERMAPFTDVPILFISSIDKTRIHKALETALDVYANLQRRVSTSELNEWLANVIEKHAIPSYGGRQVKIKYMTQLPTKTPVFAFFCNSPNMIRDAYRRYLENELREKYPYTGVPVKFVFKKK